MRILITTGLYPPDTGGPATYVKCLAEELPKEGVVITVLSFGTVRKLPTFIRHIVYTFKVIRKGRNAQIIYAQDPVSVGLPSFIAARFLGKKFFLKVVGDYAWEQGRQRFGVKDSLDTFNKNIRQYGFFVKVFAKLERLVARNAYCVIVPSKYLKHVIIEWGVSEKAIRVIYNSVALPRALPARSEVRDKLLLSGFVICSAGRLVPWKGFSEVISVVSRLKKEISDVKLYIIGDGPEHLYLKNVIAESGAGNHIFLLGKKKHNELLEYMRAADVFMLNTSYEGMSHILLEAMTVGVPIVTTSAGGNKEIIDNNKNGLVADTFQDMESALKLLYRDRKFSEKLAFEARRSVESFTYEHMIRETVKVFHEGFNGK